MSWLLGDDRWVDYLLSTGAGVFLIIYGVSLGTGLFNVRAGVRALDRMSKPTRWTVAVLLAAAGLFLVIRASM